MAMAMALEAQNSPQIFAAAAAAAVASHKRVTCSLDGLRGESSKHRDWCTVSTSFSLTLMLAFCY
jgi:hypothetical protein